MNVFIDCKCKQCGKFVQLIYDEKNGELIGAECKNCDAKLSNQEIELVRHACDTLLSMKDHVNTFRVSKVHFIGPRRTKKSDQ